MPIPIIKTHIPHSFAFNFCFSLPLSLSLFSLRTVVFEFVFQPHSSGCRRALQPLSKARLSRAAFESRLKF